ncbi:MAG TPA: efflux RND transporter permease subunit, partial [Thermoleophilia bacterium]|nr:efflux RND transporter permease subunit [Thermoleophilia bacterium]
TTFARLAAGYQRLLVPALRHRKLVLVAATVLFVVSLGIVKLLRQEFVPSQDMSRFGIRFQTPVGSSLDVSERVLDQIEAFLRTRPEVDIYGGFVGGFGGGEVNSGFVFVTMKEPPERPLDPKLGRRPSQQDLMNIARQATSSIPGARIVMQDFSQRGFSATRGGGFPVEFNLRGHDWDELGRSSRVIMEKMLGSGLVTDVNSDYQVGMPEVQVVPDRNKAADLGIAMADIGETINSAIGGQRIGKFKDKGRRFDIRVRLLAPQRQRPEDIARLLVRTGSGGLVRLGDVVTIEQRPTLQSITRRDRQRAITLTANVAPGVSQGAAIDGSMQIARANLPDGYRVVASGTARTFRESFDSLFFAMMLGLIVAYMVLASQFNAFTHPFTVLLALPFSVSGALVALWAAGQSINVYSMLGIILLMGIAKKNSILLVDFTNQARATGMERHEALLHACPVRLRPILMTSIATIAGALPPALAIGPGAELQRPMALSIVGGMIVSTAFTLFVVPAAYSLIDDAVAWNDARRSRGLGLLAALRAPRSA